MIKVEHIETFGFEAAVRGMRSPMNSWEKSDSDCHLTCEGCEHQGKKCHAHVLDGGKCFHLGENDTDLMQRLYKGGTEHRKFMRQIFVSMDITAPLYWWKEFDTYKVGTTANSCSTMHKIHSKEFTLDDFSHEHLFNGMDIVEGNGDMEYYENPTTCMEYVVKVMNHYRNSFLAASEKLKRTDLTDAERKHTMAQKKLFWWQMIQLLPTSYNQKRTVTMTYENAASMIRQRSGHKLDEWREFVEILKRLSYIAQIMGGCTAEM